MSVIIMIALKRENRSLGSNKTTKRASTKNVSSLWSCNLKVSNYLFVLDKSLKWCFKGFYK